MNGVIVNNEGVCETVTIRQTKSAITCNRKRLHIHHIAREHSIVIMAIHEPHAMQCSTIPAFTFPMPPPLNAFVYPSPVYVAKIDTNGMLSALDVREFIDTCAKLGALALNPEETEAVYDVPAIPFDNVTDGNLDDPSDDEQINDDEDDESEPDDDCDEDDDEDWDVDDDDAVSTT